MNKSRFFLLAIVMITVAAGVFATRTRFFADNTALNLYYAIGSGIQKYPLDDGSVTIHTLVYNPSGSGAVAKIIGGSEVWNLYTYIAAAGYYQLYTYF